MTRPDLPAGVVVLEGTDLNGEWGRFRVFEALHHGMAICNPMSSDDLDRLVDALDPIDRERALDLACGHGELLLRMAERAAIDGVGVDLSPWVIVRAATKAAQRSLVGAVTWWVGEARGAATEPQWDIVTCLGASWIWHGFDGTARALLARGRSGARIAVGDLRLRKAVDAASVAETYGRVLTVGEQADALASLGLLDIAELPIEESGWDDYQERIEASAVAWCKLHPGEEAERFLAEQRAWKRDHDRDRELLQWTVWTARVP